MHSQDRTTVAKDVVANIAVAGVLAVGAALAFSASAAAEPPPEVPADPAVTAPPPASMLSPGATLAQRGIPGGPAGLPSVPDFAGGGNTEYMLGQSPVPAAPSGAPGTPPNLGINNSYLLAQNLVPSAPGQGQLYDVAPGDENANLSGIDWLKRMHHMHVDGYLKGGLLGQMPQQQLGEPLPGTAPPPGTNIPAGLGQNLPEPPAPPGSALPPSPPAG